METTREPLRALLIEDSERDAELLLREVRRSFDVTFGRVETSEAMRAALEKQAWDVILCDYSMPRFDALSALSLMRGMGFDLPFIIVSGTVGEEVAVEAMRAGVHDYFLKGKLGPRLAAAIERERKEAALRAERDRMQEQLLISDRMASMGILAAGVAHEINNPLACVMANLELAARAVAQQAERLGLSAEFSEVREELHDAREATERIRNIVRDLKIFSPSQEDKTGPVDVLRVMESTLRMAWNEVRHRARLVKNYGKTPLVQANEPRLGQVFLNLVVNAAQAIEEGRAEYNEIRISTSTDGAERLTVEIADTGPGMAPDVLGRLFTPFFTTKPVGVGTGLGLSICHRIVAGFGGSIDVKSVVGVGTTFRVVLPVARTDALEEAQHVALDVGARRRGRVLVVDDEPMIARAVQRTLSADHEVLAVESAAEALRQIIAGAHFDVILCDLMMPQMTGMELHAVLSQVAREQAGRMIFVTGGAFTIAARAFLDEIPNQRLEKPFDAMHLRTLINDRIR
ncbi:MAG: response regulator [Deltaproteobacteria bacterium]|nr:response regulator [Deltaproteobacteria bacterium]